MRICIPCGYLYQDDTSFKQLPDNWCCPDCGAKTESFAIITPDLFTNVENPIANNT